MADADIFSIHHMQAPHIPLEPEPFDGAVFVGYLVSVKRTGRGGAQITISVEREQVQQALGLWDATVPLSFNVEPWRPYTEGLFDDE